MMRVFGLALSAALLALPSLALSWRAWNQHEVFPVSKGVYEVLSRPGSGPADFWCGIGDFATSQLGVKATQRLYIWRGIGPSVTRPGYKAVQFALSAPKGADTSTPLTLSVKRVGDNLTAAAARQYCYGGRFDPFDRWMWN